MINVTTQTKINEIFDQSNTLNDIINPKYLKKKREKNLKFPQEWLNYEMRHNPANSSEGRVGLGF